MRLYKNIGLLLLVIFHLAGCGGSSKGPSIEIGKVYTDIWHQHSSFYDKWGVTPNSGIEFTVSVRVSVSGGLKNLSELYFQDAESGYYWSLFSEIDQVPQDECYETDRDIYECMFYSGISLNRIDLKGWEVVAENKDGEVVTKSVEFLLPGGLQVSDEKFVYSSMYTGSTVNGVAALEAMTIADNGIEFSADVGAQSFHLEFESTDDRAKNYGFYFYDGSASIESIGYVSTVSPSVVSAPMILGLKTQVDIPWSEVQMFGDAMPGDINGVHVKLIDDSIPWLDDGLWHNYISLSEFVTLAP